MTFCVWLSLLNRFSRFIHAIAINIWRQIFFVCLLLDRISLCSSDWYGLYIDQPSFKLKEIYLPLSPKCCG